MSRARPNILFLLSDDQRPDTIGALGNPLIKTPNMDRLVKQGFAFHKQFCTTPICTPARAEIFTGSCSFRNGVMWFGQPIKRDFILLPRAFQQAGYHTIHVGKWHNDGHPRDKGYNATRCVFGCDNLNDYGEHGHQMRFLHGDKIVEGHSTELFTEAALDSLRSAPRNQPWFCYVGYHAPHDPHDAPEPFASWYTERHMPLFPNHMPEHPFDNGDMTIRDEQLEDWPRTQQSMRRYRSRYYAMISHLDWHIGLILDWLDESGQADNTIVVFTSDQGLAAGSHGLLGKENMYDHSIAAPFIIRGPGIPSGGSSRSLTHQVDLFPTLCDLAGIVKPLSIKDGRSLVPIFSGMSMNVREDILCQFYSPEEPNQPLRHSQRAVRTDRWKLCWYPLAQRWQLFDMLRDPDEVVDLLASWRVRRRAAESSGAAVWLGPKWSAPRSGSIYSKEDIHTTVHDLRARMLRLMHEQGDPLVNDLVHEMQIIY